MKLTVKCVLDVSRIKDDPEVEKELLNEEKPLMAAMVRNQTVLAAVEIDLRRQESLDKIAVTLTADYPCEQVPGVYLFVGRTLAEEAFLAAEPFRQWIGPERFKNGAVDLGRERITLPLHLFRRWLLLCRTYTITGRVVKRVWRWDGIEQMFVPCDEPVPGATVQAYDVDCWWFWWRRDLVDTAITNPDGTFEMTFRWCCLRWLPRRKPKWILDPDLLHQVVTAVRPQIGPIPPEALDSPTAFETFLGLTQPTEVANRPEQTMAIGDKTTRPCGRGVTASSGAVVRPDLIRLQTRPDLRAEDVLARLRPVLPHLPCWPFRAKDCAPDIVLRVEQECAGEVRVVYDERPFQTRWNIPTHLNVTLLANDQACSIPVCSEPPAGNCLKFSAVNCVDASLVGTSAGPPDLRGYASPGSGDNPFAGDITIKGQFGAGSAVDYFLVEYAFAGGPFIPLPETNLQGFSRNYWAPPPGSLPGTPAVFNWVTFKPEPVDGRIVYKTLRRAEQEHPLPAGWLWGYLWNDVHTLFRWNSVGLDGDGFYTLRLVGYRWDAATGKLVDAQVMHTCETQQAAEERVMVRIDNRLADDPVYRVNEERPCGGGTVHLCTYEPDCDFRRVVLVRRDAAGNPLGLPHEIDPCDIVELNDQDDIIIHFKASVPRNSRDGHLLAYNLHAQWGEDQLINLLASGTLAADPDPLVGPTYADTLAGAQLAHRTALAAADPERDRPCWFGGNFKLTLKGSVFTTSCAYTLSLRVWKRTIEGCTDPVYVHVNSCAYSFTIQKP